MADAKRIIMVSDGLIEELTASQVIDFIKVDSKGIDGVGLVDAAMITLATTTIAAVAKVIIELIRKDRNVKIKYDGQTFEIETKNQNLEQVIERLKSIAKIEG